MPELLDALADALGVALDDADEDAVVEETAEITSDKYSKIAKRVLRKKSGVFRKITKKITKGKHSDNKSPNQLLQDALKNDDVSDRMRNKVKKIKLDTKTPTKYDWKYLSIQGHSDYAIERARINKYYPNKSKKTILVQLDIQFCDNKKIYSYYKVPLSIVLIMFAIPLTYLTKNEYFAGAWNWFWYSWWYKQGSNRLMKGKDLKKYAKEFRFSKEWIKMKDIMRKENE